MHKITNTSYNETYYEETLDNGLHVVLWQKKDYEKSLFMMSTPMGGMDYEQIQEDGTSLHFPKGSAHFLEHKMFESTKGDVMLEFTEMGANVNAFTSYRETCYYFSTTENPVPALHLLMDFVQSFEVSEASVEKEKGIIVEELHMYEQMSDQRLVNETYKSLYHEYPYRYDIGGDDASVNATTLADLKRCYEVNYHPGQMVLIGISAQDPQRMMEEIKKNQASKVFPNVQHVTRKSYNEPKEVVREHYAFEMDVHMPKVCLAYKLDGEKDAREQEKKEYIIKLFMESFFSPLYEPFQTWIDEEVFTDFVGWEVDINEDTGFLMLYAETNQVDRFKEIANGVIEKLKTSTIEDRIVQQIQNRTFGQSIRTFNSFDSIAVRYIRSYFAKLDLFETFKPLKDEDIVAYTQWLHSVDFSNRTQVEVLPVKED